MSFVQEIYSDRFAAIERLFTASAYQGRAAEHWKNRPRILSDARAGSGGRTGTRLPEPLLSPASDRTHDRWDTRQYHPIESRQQCRKKRHGAMGADNLRQPVLYERDRLGKEPRLQNHHDCRGFRLGLRAKFSEDPGKREWRRPVVPAVNS